MDKPMIKDIHYRRTGGRTLTIEKALLKMKVLFIPLQSCAFSITIVHLCAQQKLIVVALNVLFMLLFVCTVTGKERVVVCCGVCVCCCWMLEFCGGVLTMKLFYIVIVKYFLFKTHIF